MSKTAIKKCGKCEGKSNYQDKKYGKNNRVFNQAGTKDKPEWRCSVCGSTNPLS